MNNPSEEVRGLFLFDDDALLGCQLGQVTDSRFVGGGQDRLVRLLGRGALRRFDLGGGRSLGRVGRLGHGRLRLGCVLSLNKKLVVSSWYKRYERIVRTQLWFVNASRIAMFNKFWVNKISGLRACF